jgi:Contact-dependent growth inhibition CdiA C-terminal domain
MPGRGPHLPDRHRETPRPSDERAKKFSPAERRIAEYIAYRGAAIVSVSEGFGRHGRTPDARADDVPVEFKSLDPGASDRTVKAALNSAKGQARHAVIDTRPQDAHLENLIERALGQRFTREEGSDPYIRVDTAAVYVGGHDFDDDDITWPDGAAIPLRSRYPAMIEVRDTAGDYQRQLQIADRIFNALRSAGQMGNRVHR